MRGFSGSLPNNGLRIIGSFHMIVGLIILVLGFIQLGITSRDMDDIWNPETALQPRRYQTYTYFPVAMVIFCSMMMMTAGLLGFAAPMSYDPTRQTALVSGFKVLTIFNAIIFGPLVFVIGFTYAHLLNTNETLGAVGVSIAALGGLETFGASIVSCVICCYSPYSYDDPHDQFRYGGPPPDIYSYGAPTIRNYGPNNRWSRNF